MEKTLPSHMHIRPLPSRLWGTSATARMLRRLCSSIETFLPGNGWDGWGGFLQFSFKLERVRIILNTIGELKHGMWAVYLNFGHIYAKY